MGLQEVKETGNLSNPPGVYADTVGIDTTLKKPRSVVDTEHTAFRKANSMLARNGGDDGKECEQRLPWTKTVSNCRRKPIVKICSLQAIHFYEIWLFREGQ